MLPTCPQARANPRFRCKHKRIFAKRIDWHRAVAGKNSADKNLAGKTIHAAGGIVVRNGARPLVAVVQRSKDERWVLPRGKLKSTERPVIGARREVVEETGHRVRVREFLGAITYRARGRPKVVQFWRMQAMARPSHDLMKDIAAVEWLTLAAAIRRLSYPLEKIFLQSVGRLAIPRHKRALRRKPRTAKVNTKGKLKGKSKGKAKAKAKTKTKPKPRRRTSRKKYAGKKSAGKKRAGKTGAARSPIAPREPLAVKTTPALASAASNATLMAIPVPHSPAQTEHRSILQLVLETLAR